MIQFFSNFLEGYYGAMLSNTFTYLINENALRQSTEIFFLGEA